MKPRLLLVALLFTATRLHASLTVSTNFESASAKVLSLDETTQTIRITPAGNPDRGMPMWWFLRVDGLDSSKPLTLEVATRKVTLPSDSSAGGDPSPMNANWTFPGRAAISIDGTNCKARHNGDTEGVEDISPGLPESATATPGCGNSTHHFRAKRGERSEYIGFAHSANPCSSWAFTQLK